MPGGTVSSTLIQSLNRRSSYAWQDTAEALTQEGR